MRLADVVRRVDDHIGAWCGYTYEDDARACCDLEATIQRVTALLRRQTSVPIPTEPERRDLLAREFAPLLQMMKRERPDFDKVARRLGHVRKRDVDTPLEALAGYVAER